MNYEEFSAYIKTLEGEKKKRADMWGAAIGLQKVDGLNVSEYLLGLAVEHIEGRLTMREVERLLENKYKNNK